ncbi:hypothetical protein BCR37DRAFT_378928 [Protomyces lactucae-debilis]|uniref:PHD-type domain-containing protein n=1 Tax=Protomyces lactucae-debilis TaxID=2754530 RepID=A0A1Y2FKM9_PROLT|nr:uncharacterized protein BCR37DRAFT_378928 [Protomyces lactucae-debilis]ORY83914.1 hypothetical protein BCR37DRAFT_378928 [Protomyces lactucae-debilis]
MASTGMASCDHCSSHWHFDCLDPPLSGPPLSTKKWMCPLHAHELTPTSRIPKNPHIVDVSLRRGFANNGDVDVELESDVQESTASESDSDIGDGSQIMAKAVHMPRVKYRLPESGVALDFLDTCRRSKEVEGHKILDVLTARQNGVVRQSLLHALIDVVLNEHEQVVGEEQERSQLLALKTLMAVKGKDQLVKFLAE